MKPFSNNLLDQEYIILANYITPGSKRRPGNNLLLNPGVNFFVAHDTGNPGSTARGNVNYYENSRDLISTSIREQTSLISTNETTGEAKSPIESQPSKKRSKSSKAKSSPK